MISPRLPRDLQFHPAINNQPRSLSLAEQIDRFNREGYIGGLTAYSPVEIGEIRTYFDRLLAKVMAAGGDSYSISSAHLKYGRVWDIPDQSSVIVAQVKDLPRRQYRGGLGFAISLPECQRRR